MDPVRNPVGAIRSALSLTDASTDRERRVCRQSGRCVVRDERTPFGINVAIGAVVGRWCPWHVMGAPRTHWRMYYVRR